MRAGERHEQTVGYPTADEGNHGPSVDAVEQILVTGWFSFEEVVPTAGDLLARDVVCGWLEEAGISYDLALAPYLDGGVDWRHADPGAYSVLLFVCGPFGRRPLIEALLGRFARCRLAAVGVSVLDEAFSERLDPLLERDSAQAARADLAFAARPRKMPVAGISLSPPQHEYGEGLHEQAAEALRELARRRGLALVEVDTDLLAGKDRFRDAAEPASLIARCDVLLTTRLHGMVLALGQGVPVLAVDPIRGGAKVSRQAAAVDWPEVLPAESLDAATLDAALDRCLATGAAPAAARCGEHAREQLERTRASLIKSLAGRQARRVGS